MDYSVKKISALQGLLKKSGESTPLGGRSNATSAITNNSLADSKLPDAIKSSLAHAKKEQVAPQKPARDMLYGTGFDKKFFTKLENDERKANAAIKSGNVGSKSILSLLQKRRNTNVEQPREEIAAEVPYLDARELLPEIEKRNLNGLILDPSQQEALDNLRFQKYGVLIGSAGTGKTTTTKVLVADLEATTPVIDLNTARANVKDGANPDYAVAIAFMAFTGIAVQQMKRALDVKYHKMCDTIHAHLGFMPEYMDVYDPTTNKVKKTMQFFPTFTETNKLPWKVVVVDEAGMVPVLLWNQLMAALRPDCRIILIGDINQLPPVQGRSVLGFAMTKWPTFELTKIHRQAADNPIIANAHAILNGKFPTHDPKNFLCINVPGGAMGAFNFTISVLRKMRDGGMFKPETDTLIVPQNKSDIGQVAFNERLIGMFNPPISNEKGDLINRRIIVQTGFTNVGIAVGDKMMLTANDRSRGLNNGMTGLVESVEVNGNFKGQSQDHATAEMHAQDFSLDMIDLENMKYDDIEVNETEDESQRQASHITTLRFPNDQIISFSTAGQYRKLVHAYAKTCHKMQGSENETVVILCHSANVKMLTREWLYTAVTRGRERVILLYNDRGLQQALNTQKIKGQNIAQKAASFLALQDQADTSLPNLPEPCEVKH